MKATYPQMATDYSVKGSYENEKIKELALKQIDLQARCQSILAERPDLADSIITVLMSDYKQDVSRNYIFKEPMRAYSYFALFQYIVIGNQAHLIFDPSRDVATIRCSVLLQPVGILITLVQSVRRISIISRLRG